MTGVKTSFPRQHARTHRFTLGVPRDFTISEDGKRVLFARSRSGSDPVNCLWQFDVAAGKESLLVDPLALLGDSSEELPPEERARRERTRESSQGIVRYSTDKAMRHAVFDLGGRVFVGDVDSGETSELPVTVPAVDPRLDPTGSLVCYVSGGALRIIEAGGGGDRALLVPEAENVSYGLAEFIAAEEMGRYSGYWWSPDGNMLLVARVDTSPVRRAYVNDPAHPEQPPVELAYPFAGTDNAEVTLVLVGADDEATSTPVNWNRSGFEYMTRAVWNEHGPFIAVESRDQKSKRIKAIDPRTGNTTLLRESTDLVWLELIKGLPAWLADGSMVWTAHEGDAQRLLVAGQIVTPPEMILRAVFDVDGNRVVFAANTEQTSLSVFEWSAEGGVREIVPPLPDVPDADPARPAVRSARAAGGTTIVRERNLDRHGTSIAVMEAGGATTWIESLEETPVITPNLTLLRAGESEIRTALLLPNGHVPGTAKLPVLLDPYGGPGAQRVLSERAAFLTSQWFADQGFAVVVADGRGTPGRGISWSHAVHLDLAGPVLEDQVTALEAAAAHCPDLDLGRVAIRGWSFGGYLAALAVLRRPDVFHVAVAGAPVTDMSLYDTHWSERYLGTPESNPEAYERTNILLDAPKLSRPLMLIHGLADDNVLVAHTLQLSALLTAAGRPHVVLPLVGVTHMTPQEDVAENLLLLQLQFIKDAFAALGNS
jgi:dipeptidyl-peptidase-4